ncbi:MAG: 16S rRNA (guanine(527)-N(7))-methyltransferase RsmG [Bacteroidia bacterium]|nr:16S rRNA (guanine(527)-N(7))-methyltransferase RsmG [Bacteroidia bacterium]
MTLIKTYFPELTSSQIQQFEALPALYKDWNSKINVISRKDIDELYLRHILHSLSIAKIIQFKEGSKILDVGTGGGFPGIPLAILFPETSFHLVDSIGKKLKVIDAVSSEIGLQNVKTFHARVEDIEDQYDFIVSRAVTRMPEFVQWVKGKTLSLDRHQLKNGILYLKGGDLAEELNGFPDAKIFNISEVFKEEFFLTKKVVYIEL